MRNQPEDASGQYPNAQQYMLGITASGVLHHMLNTIQVAHDPELTARAIAALRPLAIEAIERLGK